jgi:phage I-like protein
VAKRSRESFQKRARERARQKKQADKRDKRRSPSSDGKNVSKAEEDALMEEFAALSARLEAEQITPDMFNDERERILGQLGLDAD